ncbi:MAG: hypothetical protein OXH36_00030 [Bdellovibrionales bacterium]|nr:hypothetical protein [Bdellovibrionales bacterium]
MTYRKDSGWNDKTEMMCLLILKKLQAEGFPRGRQSELCTQMSRKRDVCLSYGTINMKVQNYMYLDTEGCQGLAGYSQNSERIYNKYHNFSIKQLEEEIDSHG